MFVILELSLIDISNDYKTNQKTIFMSKFTPEQISEINDKLKTPEEVLQWGLENIDGNTTTKILSFNIIP
mgnify:CR=1 FL=1